MRYIPSDFYVGIYKETLVHKAGRDTFKSYEKEYMLITVLDKVTGWNSHQGNTVKASFTRVTPEIFKSTQVLVNGRHMYWARYPDEDGETLSREDMSKVAVRQVGHD